jgi:hypothetical protein
MAQDDFLTFRKLISGSIIKVIYALGFVVITAGGLIWAAAPFLTYYAMDARHPMTLRAGLHVAGGLVLLTFGNLFWRLACEGWILLFSLHEMMASIEKTLASTAEFAENAARQLHAIEANTEQRHQELLDATRQSAHIRSLQQ